MKMNAKPLVTIAVTFVTVAIPFIAVARRAAVVTVDDTRGAVA